MVFEFGDEPFDMMSTTIVSCAVTKGDLPIDIKWLFNGRHLRTNDGILLTNKGLRISMLSIESVQPRHAGNYTCIAKNNAGEAQHTSELKVIGKPKL
jgi:hypothetical protein